MGGYIPFSLYILFCVFTLYIQSFFFTVSREYIPLYLFCFLGTFSAVVLFACAAGGDVAADFFC